MLCPKCDHPNPSYARICLHCGWDIETEVQEKKDRKKFDKPSITEAIEKKPINGVIAK